MSDYNTPVMYTDSTGHSWESFWKTTFGVMAGIAIGAVAVTAIIASGGTLLVPALIGIRNRRWNQFDWARTCKCFKRYRFL